MHRYVLMIVFAVGMAAPAWSQDEDSAADDADTAAAETGADDVAEDESADEELDDTDLDEQNYENEDDDFRPSETISTDQSIAFPTDI